jgi:hypothetical protein
VEINPSIAKRITIDTPKWEIRIFGEEFKNWISSHHTNTLFFDGASRNNPGATGARGGIYEIPEEI